jgi:hypothetical protein
MHLVGSMLASNAPHARDQKLRRSDVRYVVCVVDDAKISIKTLEKGVRICATLEFY